MTAGSFFVIARGQGNGPLGGGGRGGCIVLRNNVAELSGYICVVCGLSGAVATKAKI